MVDTPKTVKKKQKQVKQLKWVQRYIPKVKRPFHIVCCVLNIFLPGVGTIIGAIIDHCDWVNVCFGIVQLLTALLIIGWLWSIVWGFAMYKRNSGPGKHLPRMGRAESVGDVIPKTRKQKSKSGKSKSGKKGKEGEKAPLLAKDKKFFDLPI